MHKQSNTHHYTPKIIPHISNSIFPVLLIYFLITFNNSIKRVHQVICHSIRNVLPHASAPNLRISYLTLSVKLQSCNSRYQQLYNSSRISLICNNYCQTSLHLEFRAITWYSEKVPKYQWWSSTDLRPMFWLTCYHYVVPFSLSHFNRLKYFCLILPIFLNHNLCLY